MAGNPQAEIWVKGASGCPGRKENRLFRRSARHATRYGSIAENVSPQSLLRHVSRVYVVTSQYGFEALLAGKPVTCFGAALVCRLGLNRRSPSAVRFVICPTGALRRWRSFLPLHTCVTVAISTRSRGPQAICLPCCNGCNYSVDHLQQRDGYLWAPGLTLWKSAILKPFLRTATNRLSFSRRCTAASGLRGMGCKGRTAMASRSAAKITAVMANGRWFSAFIRTWL